MQIGDLLDPKYNKPYGVIYADPPWTFITRSDNGKGRSAENHYSCLSLQDLHVLEVPHIGAKDCVLLMWVTDPLLAEGLKLIKSWGFTYKTVGFYWAKLNMNNDDFFTGMGYWTRANPEQCLLATRGAPKRLNKDVRRLIVSPRREHSRKPAEAYGRIERLCPGPYLELFARTQRPGWDAWGNEVDKFAGVC